MSDVREVDDNISMLDVAREAIKGNFVSKEEKARRMAVCNKPCDFKGEGVGGIAICTVCICPLATRLAFVKFKCPKGLW